MTGRGMTAQLLPIGPDDEQDVTLHVKGPTGRWRVVARAPVVVPGYTATFRVASWPADKDVPYRVEYGTHNYARTPAGWLPEIVVSGGKDPVVQVAAEGSSEILYTLRVNGDRFHPWVFDAAATYTVRVEGLSFTGQAASRKPDNRVLEVDLRR